MNFFRTTDTTDTTVWKPGFNDEGGNCQIISNALDLSNPQNIFNLLITG